MLEIFRVRIELYRNPDAQIGGQVLTATKVSRGLSSKLAILANPFHVWIFLATTIGLAAVLYNKVSATFSTVKNRWKRKEGIQLKTTKHLEVREVA